MSTGAGVSNGGNVAAAYIDLATYDQLEKYLYGGCYAVTPFVREVTKSTWFSLIPTRLTTTGGNVAFGGEFSATISRAGDYLTHNWFRVVTPAVSYDALYGRGSSAGPERANFDAALQLAFNAWRPYSTGQGRSAPAPAIALRWTRNFMHNLVKSCSITFNDLVETQFTSTFLDFWAAFTVPKDKRQAYDTMIGNVAELFDPLSLDSFQLGPTGTLAGTATITGGTASGSAWSSEIHLGPSALGITGAAPGGVNAIGTLTTTGSGTTGIYCGPLKGRYLPSRVLNLPLPLPHDRTTGVALPTAALPYNEMKINFQLREAYELLIADVYDASVPGNAPAFPGFSINLSSQAGSALPGLTGHVWAEYAIVSNAERARMGCHPRDMLIEQQQEMAKYTVNSVTSTTTHDLRFSHAVRAIFFAFKNTTLLGEHSNYTAAVPVAFPDGVNFSPFYAVDPVAAASLLYEGTVRMDTLSGDYYSLVNPFYHSEVVAEETGYHVYSYAIDLYACDPNGSTNMGKLSNVSMQFNVSDAAQTTLAAPLNPSGYSYVRGQVPRLTTGGAFVPDDWYWGNAYQSQFEPKIVVVNHQIVRVSGGTFAFPVL